jgi:hypothetical protein
MEKATLGLEGVSVYLDDIIVTGRTQKEHDERLIKLLTRLRDRGFRLKPIKCEWSKPSLQYLGLLIDSTGIKPLPSKIDAILKAPKPTNANEVRSFIGIINYYAKFIRDLATTAVPLYDLLRKDATWIWSAACDKAYNTLRHAVTSDSTLIHFQSSLPLVLDCDASSYGIGAVLQHVMPDGSHRPIAYASKTLSSAEKNYAQIEREALSILFGVKKFHRYLFGRHFTLVTDHKPLLIVLGPKGHITSTSASRLHRWSAILAAYDFSITFRPTKQHANADYLSRFPVPCIEEPCIEAAEEQHNTIAFLDDVVTTPLTHNLVRKAILRDPLLTEVMSYVQSGWPFDTKCSRADLQPFFVHRHEMSIVHGCLMWGLRLIIPVHLRADVLKSLHESHAGIVRMKSIARSYVWWPGIDAAIEEIARACVSCAQVQATPTKAPLHPWSFPQRPWQRLHIDFCGPEFGHIWLILIDAHSKWLEAIPFTSMPSSATLIEALRTVFSRFGLPEEIVSDNGTQFTSLIFKSYCESEGIRQRFSAPYHPASNGEAERAVRTFKHGLRSFEAGNWKTDVQRFLLSYRTTPHATTGCTPSELLMGRTVRTRWDLLRPTCHEKVDEAQRRQIDNYAGKLRQFEVGDLVWARNFRLAKTSWTEGQIVEVNGPRNYSVTTEFGLWKRHINQLRKRTPIAQSVTDLAWPDVTPTATPIPVLPVVEPDPVIMAQPPPAAVLDPQPGPVMPLRRSKRIPHPPDRYSP